MTENLLIITIWCESVPNGEAYAIVAQTIDEGAEIAKGMFLDDFDFVNRNELLHVDSERSWEVSNANSRTGTYTIKLERDL